MSWLQLIDKLPAGLRIRRLLETIWAEITFPQSCPPGHFYSPLPARREIEQDSPRIFGRVAELLPEINLNETEQLHLLQRLAKHVKSLELPDTFVKGRRFYLQNDYFIFADAI